MDVPMACRSGMGVEPARESTRKPRLPRIREWQPVPLELPVDDPYRRPPSPADGGPKPPADDDNRGRVIVIELA